ncbi:MAG TPA: DUF1080 domain-containing protein, partial [Segetibacter sp.]
MLKSSFIILSLGSIIFCACSSSKSQSVAGQPNMLSSKEKNDGWELLFDGKTTNGWHTYNKDFVGKNWNVV